jgi:diacylglycerol kinase family enzyme
MAFAYRVRDAFRAAGVDAEVLAVRGTELRERARQAAAAPGDAVIAGGGDGTISTVAGALTGTSKPLGILPLGTLNHFARDLLALVPACLTAFRRYPLVEVRLTAGRQTEGLTTPLRFVGNNRYKTDLLAPRGRASLEHGELSLYLIKGRDRFTLLRLALRALVGRLDEDWGFREMCLPEFEVDTPQRRLLVAADGEVLTLRPPLQYRVRPGALQVFLPATAWEQEMRSMQARPTSLRFPEAQ